jgi:competence protein ComEC
MTSRSLGHRAPLLWLVLPLIAGLTIGRLGDFAPVGAQLAAALGCAIAAVVTSWRGSRGWAPAILATMLLAGSASYSLHRARLADWETLPPREARLGLRIDRVFPQDDPRKTAGLAVVVKTDPHLHDLLGQRVYFSLVLPAGEKPPVRSAVLATVGVLAPLPRDPPLDSFDSYLAGAGVNFRLTRGRIVAEDQPPTRYHVFLERTAEKLNAWLSAGIATKRPELAAVFRAMMLGQKHELSDEQDELFMHSGTMHLFAINGLHIGVVALSLHALLALLRCPRPAAALLTLAVLWLDVDTTGASPSAVRAFLLVAFYEAAFVLRRPANGVAALSGAALVVLLVEPMALFSASFQMSYGVVLAILCFGLPLAERIQQTWSPFRDVPGVTLRRWQRAWAAALRWFWPVLGIGLAAALVSAVTGPAFFKVFAPGGLIANLVLVPLAMLVIVAGFTSILAGVIGFTAATVLFNHAALTLLVVIDALIRWNVRLPAVWHAAQWRVAWAAPVALGAVLATVLAGYASGWRRERGGWWPPAAIVAVALVFGVKFG